MEVLSIKNLENGQIDKGEVEALVCTDELTALADNSDVFTIFVISHADHKIEPFRIVNTNGSDVYNSNVTELKAFSEPIWGNRDEFAPAGHRKAGSVLKLHIGRFQKLINLWTEDFVENDKEKKFRFKAPQTSQIREFHLGQKLFLVIYGVRKCMSILTETAYAAYCLRIGRNEPNLLSCRMCCYDARAMYTFKCGHGMCMFCIKQYSRKSECHICSKKTDNQMYRLIVRDGLCPIDHCDCDKSLSGYRCHPCGCLLLCKSLEKNSKLDVCPYEACCKPVEDISKIFDG